MVVCKCGRANAFLLFAALFLALFSNSSGVALHAQVQPPAQRWDGLLELISGRYQTLPPSAQTAEPADGPSTTTRHAISGDGRYIVFTADAPNLGFSSAAVYIRDRRTNEVFPLLGGTAQDAVISADGNHVAFKLCDPWMRPDLADICDVWAIDLRNWGMTVMSALPNGEHGAAHSGQPVLSSTGRFVVFQTTALNLMIGAHGQDAGIEQLVIRDRDPDGNGIFDEPGTAVLEAITISPAGSMANAASDTAEVSDDGQIVAFRSKAGNLGSADHQGTWDVFRRDRSTRRTTKVNLRYTGTPSPVSVESAALSMSADGRVIAFASADEFLAPGPFDDTNETLDVFIYDAADPTMLRRIDIGEGWPVADGYIPGNGPSQWPSLSADGRYVAFESAATNVALPPPAGSTQVYVFDRAIGKPTRISVRPDGTQPDADSVRPGISADGSLVAFTSSALNLAPNVQTPLDRVYAAVHLSVSPAEVFVPRRGGVATFNVTAQQHTQWWVDWSEWSQWIWIESQPSNVGSGELRLRVGEINTLPAPRSATIRIFEQKVVVTQEAGLSLTSVSPASGPQAGGTRVTLRGTGFEPDALVEFGGVAAASVEFVDSTTLIATTPAHEPGSVYVVIFSAEGGGAAWMDSAFHFDDGTPPEVWYSVQGSQNGTDGWYQSDVVVFWGWWDPESQVTSTHGCDNAVITEDTPGTTITCTVTSEGGTTAVPVMVKRDATPPAVEIVSPSSTTLYELNSSVAAQITCTDALSGISHCGDWTNEQPVDTSFGGWRPYFVVAFDNAGNPGWGIHEYAVSMGVCLPASPGFKLWFEFDGSARDAIHGSPHGGSQPQHEALTYVAGKVGQALSLPGWQSFSFPHELADVQFRSSMTFAAWVKADGHDGEAGVIASKEDQFRIARFPDGTIRWAFANDPAFDWVDTGAVMPQGQWSHLVLTYDHGVVNTYLNGRLAHSHAGTGEMTPVQGLPYWGPWLSLGNRFDPSHKSFLIGAIDEAQFLDVVWDSTAVEASYFAGAQGTCRLTPSVSIAAESEATFGSSSYQARAQLLDAATQQPIAGRTLRLVSHVSADGLPVGTVTAVTDDYGWATFEAPMSPNASAQRYDQGFDVFFDSDFQYGGSRGIGAVLVAARTPIVTWPIPQPIPSSTPLGPNQLNATADVPGTFLYSPASGTVLAPGQHTLSVEFDPDNANYRNASASVTVVVEDSTATLTWNQPASIVYGTPLGESQLNAASNVPGTWSYSPAAGTVLNAGPDQTLTATFTPADTTSHSTTITTSIDVLKRLPAITVTGGTFTYDGAAHAATASATGLAGADLGPIELTYNGSTTAPVDAGTYAVVASYAGNDNYSAASATATVTIAKATPVVDAIGGSFTYDGAAHAATGTVTGVNGADLGPLSFRYNGSPEAPVNAGTYAVVASYEGSANYQAAAAEATITIGRAAASLTWGRPAGIVYGTPLGSAQLNASANVAGSFVYSVAAGTVLNAGADQSLSATFAPADPANYTGGTVATTIDVASAPLTVRANDATKRFGAPLPVFTASATGFVNGDSFGSLSGALAFATTATQSSAVGVYPIVAAGLASPNYAIVYVNGALSIVRGAVAVSVASSQDPTGYNQPMTFTTAVGAVAPAVGQPSGTVQFFDGATLLGTATLNGGTATLTTAGLSVGSHAIEVQYNGNGSFEAGTGTAAHTVADVSQTPSISVTSSKNPSNEGQTVTLTANVTMVTGPVSGVIEFYSGATLLGSSPISEGRATLTTSSLPASSHAVTARYPGSAAAPPSRSDVFVQAVGEPGWKDRATSMSLAPAQNPVALGDAVAFVATVSGSWGSAPTGRVLFMVNGEVIGEAPVTALSETTARAALSVSGLNHGRHVVTATYLGDPLYKGSTAAVAQIVN